MNWDNVNRHLWQKTRALVFAVKGTNCTIRLPGCTGHATQVDHIIPLHQGGKVYDLSNLRPACWNCNRHRNPPALVSRRAENW